LPADVLKEQFRTPTIEELSRQGHTKRNSADPIARAVKSAASGIPQVPAIGAAGSSPNPSSGTTNATTSQGAQAEFFQQERDDAAKDKAPMYGSAAEGAAAMPKRNRDLGDSAQKSTFGDWVYGIEHMPGYSEADGGPAVQKTKHVQAVLPDFGQKGVAKNTVRTIPQAFKSKSLANPVKLKTLKNIPGLEAEGSAYNEEFPRPSAEEMRTHRALGTQHDTRFRQDPNRYNPNEPRVTRRATMDENGVQTPGATAVPPTEQQQRLMPGYVEPGSTPRQARKPSTPAKPIKSGNPGYRATPMTLANNSNVGQPSKMAAVGDPIARTVKSADMLKDLGEGVAKGIEGLAGQVGKTLEQRKEDADEKDKEEERLEKAIKRNVRERKARKLAKNLAWKYAYYNPALAHGFDPAEIRTAGRSLEDLIARQLSSKKPKKRRQGNFKQKQRLQRQRTEDALAIQQAAHEQLMAELSLRQELAAQGIKMGATNPIESALEFIGAKRKKPKPKKRREEEDAQNTKDKTASSRGTGTLVAKKSFESVKAANQPAPATPYLGKNTNPGQQGADAHQALWNQMNTQAAGNGPQQPLLPPDQQQVLAQRPQAKPAARQRPLSPTRGNLGPGPLTGDQFAPGVQSGLGMAVTASAHSQGDLIDKALMQLKEAADAGYSPDASKAGGKVKGFPKTSPGVPQVPSWGSDKATRMPKDTPTGPAKSQSQAKKQFPAKAEADPAKALKRGRKGAQDSMKLMAANTPAPASTPTPGSAQALNIPKPVTPLGMPGQKQASADPITLLLSITKASSDTIKTKRKRKGAPRSVTIKRPAYKDPVTGKITPGSSQIKHITRKGKKLTK